MTPNKSSWSLIDTSSPKDFYKKLIESKSIGIRKSNIVIRFTITI